MNKGVIILGSSRSDGNTFKVAKILKENTGFEIIDLNKKKIGYFDYEFENKNDDFKLIFKDIAQNYQTIIFATPVYWYSMSGIIKVFLDRVTDFLYNEKEYGRMLRGKNMGVISCSKDDDKTEGFNLPFIRTAAYLGMNYVGDIHTWTKKGSIPLSVKEKIVVFALKIKECIY